MKHKIYINKKTGKTNFGPIYSENKDCGDMEEVVLNHTIDKTNPSVCLNIMMVVGDYSKEEVVANFIESLKCFEFIFKSVFIVIDNKSKFDDAIVDEQSMNKFIEKLKENKIISNDAIVRVDALQYKTKAKEYKELLFTIFNYKSMDDIYVDRTYKNAFAYYYSLYHSPDQYMFHIDIPRYYRSKYIKSDNDEKDNNYVLKCVNLLKECERACFVGLLASWEGFVKNHICKNEFSVYFDGKIQISLQCWVCDTNKWRPTKDTSKYHCGFYRYQTENAISAAIPGRGLTSLALYGCEVNVNKVAFR